MAASGHARWLAMVGALALVPSLVFAAKPKAGEYNPDHQSVEMFKAIEAGQIEVKLIPKDVTECNVLITNKTDKPLNVELPGAFAGVPVLAQFGGGMGGGGMGGGMSGGMNQGMMGGMGGGGMMGGGMGGGGMGGGGGNFFNVAPEKVGKLACPTVCLEHGKRDPRPAVPYEIKPIESFTDKVEVHEVGRMLGRGMISQRAAQVAAWHLQNSMSFQELAAKQLRFANGATQSYFSPQEIQAGMKIVAVATELAKQREKSSGQSESLSQN